MGSSSPLKEVGDEEAFERVVRMRRKILEAILTELTGPPSKEKTSTIFSALAWVLAELVELVDKDSYAEALLTLLSINELTQGILYHSMVGEEMVPPGKEPAQGKSNPLEEGV